MKIVVLDGYTLNPGDLDWSALKALGETVIYDRTPNDLIMERAQDADIILTNKTPISKNTILHLPKLKFIGILATGYDIVDVETARKNNIPVSNASGYAIDSVAQHTFAMILSLTNKIQLHDQKVKDGYWKVDFSFFSKPLEELADKTIGLVGYGRIGQRVGELAEAFGMKVQINRKSQEAEPKGVSLDQVIEESDILSLHCPLTHDNKNLINEARLKAMKSTAYLINTARGPLVDEKALAKALRNGDIAGAGLDVLSNEPPKEENPMFKAPNCIVTPHNAWATVSSRKRLMEIVVANTKAFIEGNPQNVVN